MIIYQLCAPLAIHTYHSRRQGRRPSSMLMSKATKDKQPGAHRSCVRARDERRPAVVAVMCLGDLREGDGELNAVEQQRQ